MKSELFYSSVDKCCQVLSQPLADQNRAVSDFSGAINISGQGTFSSCNAEIEIRARPVVIHTLFCLRASYIHEQLAQFYNYLYTNRCTFGRAVKIPYFDPCNVIGIL